MLFENETKNVIKKLAARRMKSGAQRNLFVGIIISLTACILSFISCYGYNVTEELAGQTGYQVLYSGLTPEDTDRLKGDERIAQMGLFLSAGMTTKVNGVSMSLDFSDEQALALSGISIEKGRLPGERNEIALEQDYLAEIGSRAGLGDWITLEYRNHANRKLVTSDFVIVGFLSTSADGEKNRVAYQAVVSDAYIQSDTALGNERKSAMVTVRESEKYSNEDLKDLVKRIGTDSGLTEDQIQMNALNIDKHHMSPETVSTILAAAAVMLFGCALVIYNIFYISVIENVAEFGQLRTLGASSRQLKKMMNRESRILALTYIPPGSLAGLGLAFLADSKAFRLSIDLVLAVVMGILVYLTVKFSAHRPVKTAAGISPMAALRYNAYDCVPGGRKRKVNLSPMSLAGISLCRNKKKTFLTLLSLIFSGGLFISVSTILASFDPQARAALSFPYGSHFLVELNKELLSPSFSMTDLQLASPLTEELVRKLEQLNGIESVDVMRGIQPFLGDDKIDLTGMNDKDYGIYSEQLIQGSLPLPSDVGRSTMIVNKDGPEIKYLQTEYEVGDKVSLLIPDGSQYKEAVYTVAAVISDQNSSNGFILPEAELEALVPFNSMVTLAVTTSKDWEEEAEALIRAVMGENDMLRMKTLKELTKEYKSLFQAITAAVCTFAAFIILFSLINLINTIMTNLISRRKELALLWAVGLDKGQMIRMINWENGFLTVVSFATALVLGSMTGKAGCSVLQNMPGFNFVQYKFPFLLTGCYLVVILVVQIAISRSSVRYLLNGEEIIE